MLAVSVITFGCLFVVLWGIALPPVFQASHHQLVNVFGDDGAARIEMHMGERGARGDALSDAFDQEIRKKFGNIPDEEKGRMMMNIVMRTLREAKVPLMLLVTCSAVLGLIIHSFFFAIGANADTKWSAVLRRTGRLIPRMIGLWLLLFCLFVVWIPILAFIAVFIRPILVLFVVAAAVGLAAWFGPRLVFAPVLLAQGKTSILQSIRKSVALAKGKWLRIVGNLLGVGAVTWIGTTLASILLNIIIRIALPFTPFAVYIGQLMILFTMLAMAYRIFFVVHLKDAVSGK
jgi:hypothetical protein